MTTTRDLLRTIERAQELMRSDSLHRIVDAARQQEALLRSVSSNLTGLTSAADAARNAMSAMQAASTFQRPAFDVTASMAAGDAMERMTAAMEQASRLPLPAIDGTALATASEAMRKMTAVMEQASRSQVPLFATMRTITTSYYDAACSIRAALGNGLLEEIRSVQQGPARWPDALRVLRGVEESLPLDALAGIAKAAESLKGAMPLIDPALFGDAWNDTLAQALARLYAHAEQIAKNPAATVADVEALADEVQAATDAAPAKARGAIEAYLVWILMWLWREARKDAAKKLIYGGLGHLLVVVLSFATPPTLPETVPPPPLLAAPSAFQTMPGYLTEGLPAVIRRAGPIAEVSTVEFLDSIRSLNTQRAYAHALTRFTNWCDDRNLELVDVTAFTVNAYVEAMKHEYATRTIRQHLAAIRLLFDRLVVNGVLPLNPAAEVRGPKEATPKVKISGLRPGDARKLLESVDVSLVSGLRDRALLATMLYGFARVSTLVSMNVTDYLRRGDERWLRLHDTVNTWHDVPAHPEAEEYLDAYLTAAGIGADPNSPLWRSITRRRALSDRRMSRVDVFRVVKQRAREAGLPIGVTCRTLRATALTAYLANGGTRAGAQAFGAYASARSVKQYESEPSSRVTAADIAKVAL